MAQLASVADVRRILRIPDANVNAERDAQLRAALEAIEPHFRNKLRKISRVGPQMETFFDVSEDATLRMPAEDVTVTKVNIFEYPSSIGIPLSPIELGLGHGYDLTDDGCVILRPTLGFSPFEGATAQRRLRAYSRVEVHYIGTGVIPRDVTEGIAYIAAGWYTDGPRALTGLTSEKIGDYQYTLGSNTTPDGIPSFWDRGMLLLKDYLNSDRITVV